MSYVDHADEFSAGADSPRAYLERCLERIAALEPDVRGWVVLDAEEARRSTDASTARWRGGSQRSLLDGIPIGIKDLLETKDFPTQMGSAAYRDNFPRHDNPAVWALRQAGAVILGKTVTTEFGSAEPTNTANPFDVTRSPGGSSSGSAAVVGGGMIPAAIGTQVGSSILRPASYCGCFGFKPTFGGINRGERQQYSQSATGVLAGSLSDAWQIAIEIVHRVGGDPGRYGLVGPSIVPAAARPTTLAVMETDRWSAVEPQVATSFEFVIHALVAGGIEIVRRTDCPPLDRFEGALTGMMGVSRTIVDWERQWSLRNTVEAHPEGVTKRSLATLRSASGTTLEQYRDALDRRDEMVRRLSELGPYVDGFISPGAQGVPPPFDRSLVGTDEYAQGNPMGMSSFNQATSMLGTPGISIPHISIGGLPVGLQVMTLPRSDSRAFSIARWIAETIAPISL